MEEANSHTGPLPAYGIIPARYDSVRFPGKPLLMLKGRPMFWHVWNRARQCPDLASVTLATDDERIMAAARELAVPVLLTSRGHQSGTDRIFEAARMLDLPGQSVVVNIQGDEPALDPSALTELLRAFRDSSVRVATLAHILAPEDLANPDKVKIVLAANGDALYFSRAAIPYARDGAPACMPLGHIGLYAFTMPALERFVSLPPSSLERTEKLEQLRLLENGIPIRVVLTAAGFQGVDSRDDVARVLPLLE